jgi:hypothetical protein
MLPAIEVREDYRMSMQNPNVEHLMPLPLPQAVADWARYAFPCNGFDCRHNGHHHSSGFRVCQGSADDGRRAWLVHAGSGRALRCEADWSSSMSKARATIAGSGDVNLTRGQTMGENASIQDRDRAWTNIEEALLTDLDASTQKLLQERLPFLLN